MSTDARVARDARRFTAPIGIIVLVVVCSLVTAALLWRGYDFYSLGLDARVDHDDFRLLSPGEVVGHGYGIVGTALFLVNLAYVVRRRFPRLPLGPMRVWLDMHALSGLVGSLLILFHSAFQLRTPIATVTAGSLVLVVLTGFVGRYLYALSPKVDTQLQQANIDALGALVPGLGDKTRAVMERIPITDVGGSASLLFVLRTLPTWFGEGRSRRREIRGLESDRISALDSGERLLARRALRQVASLAAQEARTMAASTLLRTWRGLHRLLAVLMLLTVSVHIAVAWFYGYRWVWSE